MELKSWEPYFSKIFLSQNITVEPYLRLPLILLNSVQFSFLNSRKRKKNMHKFGGGKYGENFAFVYEN